MPPDPAAAASQSPVAYVWVTDDREKYKRIGADGGGFEVSWRAGAGGSGGGGGVGGGIGGSGRRL